MNSAFPRASSRMRLRSIFLAPTALVMFLLFFVPLLIALAYSLLTPVPYGGVFPPWTLENYRRALDPLYLAMLWRSVWRAAVSTALCLLRGFPLALYMARYARHKTLLLNL